MIIAISYVTENEANAPLIEKVIKENRLARYINITGST